MRREPKLELTCRTARQSETIRAHLTRACTKRSGDRVDDLGNDPPYLSVQPVQTNFAKTMANSTRILKSFLRIRILTYNLHFL
jgi:hypothetical protein